MNNDNHKHIASTPLLGNETGDNTRLEIVLFLLCAQLKTYYVHTWIYYAMHTELTQIDCLFFHI